VDALVHHYATHGWAVDGVPAGATPEFTMRRGREAWLVDCAYADQATVSRIPVEELLDEIVLRGATGGVLVTRGTFTDAALDAAAQRPHVRLVDGAALGAMLGTRSDARRRFDQARSAATRPMASLAVVTAGVFLLSLSLGLMALVAYLLTRSGESAAFTPPALASTVAPLPAPQPPAEGHVAHAAGRTAFPVGAARISRPAGADTPVRPASRAEAAAPAWAAPEGVQAPTTSPGSPTAADEAMAVIAADTPEVGRPH
jgi:hypothetical protein